MYSTQFFKTGDPIIFTFFLNWQWKGHNFDILVAMIFKTYLISLLQSVKETLQSRKMPNKFEDPKNPHHTHLEKENH